MISRLKNPTTGEVKLVVAFSEEDKRLRRYGWQYASLVEFNQWMRRCQKTN